MTDDVSEDVETPVLSPVTGLVAEVVSDREVILNRGTAHGVYPGMYFKVLNPAAKNVTDPETDESLGDLQVVKVVVQAIEVAPRLTLARTFRTRRVNVGGNASPGLTSIMASMREPKWIEQVERLTMDEHTPRAISPRDSIVHRGDPFEEASRNEAQDVRSVTVWKALD